MILRSILDTDLYKLTMQRAVLARFRGVPVRYVFHDRRPEGRFTAAFLDRLVAELRAMRDLALTDAEVGFLRARAPWLGEEYLQYLRNYRYDPAEVAVELKDGDLRIEIAGLWERTILWEVPLMAMISELFFETCDVDWTWDEPFQTRQAEEKARTLAPSRFADFGTRRRRSYAAQDLVARTMRRFPGFTGTSNVHLARVHDVSPRGTMAHEWIMGVSALEGLSHANRHALWHWKEVYKGRLGIALTDTFGSDAFFRDFDGELSMLYAGVRHDSGSPFEFIDRAVAHYRGHAIDPLHKVAVFTDGLSPSEANAIAAACEGRMLYEFGIGTNFTNDVPGSKPLNMVVKLAACGGVPVVKLSDVPTKAIGDRDALRVARWTFGRTPLDA